VTTDSFLAPGYSGPLFLGLIAIMLMLFHVTVGHIVDRWDAHGGYLHGWLILGLIGWMLWGQRSTVLSVVRGRRWPFLILGHRRLARRLQ
jgi:hypothetical protein